MKKFFAFCLVLSISCGLMGQKAALFTYDHDRVNTVMEQINESDKATGCGLTLIADTLMGSATSNAGYFVIGWVPACAVSMGGCFTGLLIESGSYAGLVVGSILGLIVPVLAVSIKTRDAANVGNTFFGSIVGVAPGIISYFAVQRMEQVWTDYWTSFFSGCAR